MCCARHQGLWDWVHKQYPQKDKEYTFYKVVNVDSHKGTNWDHVYKPGIHVSTYGPGFHLCLTRKHAKQWTTPARKARKIVPVRVKARDIRNAGHDGVYNCQIAAQIDKFDPKAYPQIVVSRLRIDKREWKRAGF